MTPKLHRSVARIAAPVSGRESHSSKLNPPRVETCLQVRLTDDAIFRVGRNKLTLHFQAADARAGVQVVEVHLAVLDGR